MEYLDLYDINRIKTGHLLRRGDRPSGEYYLCVQVMLISHDGRILIQKRQKNKVSFPDVWDLSVCGSVQAGETSQEGASRELFEELGIKYDFTGRRPNVSVSFSEGYTDAYVVRMDADTDSLALQKEEVADARWATLEEVLSMIGDGSFVPYYPSWVCFLHEQGGRYGSIDGTKIGGKKEEHIMAEEFEEYVTFHVTSASGEDIEMAVMDEFDFEGKHYVAGAVIKDDVIDDSGRYIYESIIDGDDFTVQKIRKQFDYNRIARAYMEME